MGFGEACRADQAEKATHYDNKFHEVILRVVDNECTMEFFHMLPLHVQRVKYHYFRRDMLRKTSVEHYRDILEVPHDRDADLVAEPMRSHWLYVTERCSGEVEVEGVQ